MSREPRSSEGAGERPPTPPPGTRSPIDRSPIDEERDRRLAADLEPRMPPTLGRLFAGSALVTLGAFTLALLCFLGWRLWELLDS